MSDAENESGQVRPGVALGGAVDPERLIPPDTEPLVDSTDYDAEYAGDLARDLGGGITSGGLGDDGEDEPGELEGDEGADYFDPAREGFRPASDFGLDGPTELERALRSTGLRRPGDGGSAGGDPVDIREGASGAERLSALEDGARSVGRAARGVTGDDLGPAGARFHALLVDGLNRPHDAVAGADKVKGRVFKVSSLANGAVSLVFHVNPEDANKAMGFMHLRGVTVELSVERP